ncbi:MAG: DUF2214 family protein [Anaerolineae bacterium]|nr:DUF2214 family protein [Gemmatimonadaceae bacterium]
MLRITLAALHLIALGIGLSSVLARGTALRESPTRESLRRIFRADLLWGIAAALWISTGLWRVFGETEKTVGFYFSNHLFLTKMALLVVILALELWAAITLGRWRREVGRGESPETVFSAKVARRIATISHVEATLVVLMVFLAVSMARGFGSRG